MSPSEGSSKIVIFLGIVAVDILVLKIQSLNISWITAPTNLCRLKLCLSVSRSLSISRSEELTRSVTSVDIREPRLTSTGHIFKFACMPQLDLSDLVIFITSLEIRSLPMFQCLTLAPALPRAWLLSSARLISGSWLVTILWLWLFDL